LRYTLIISFNITMRIYSQTIHLLKHRSGIVGIPRRSIYLQVSKKEYIGELLIDTSPTGICINKEEDESQLVSIGVQENTKIERNKNPN